MAGNRFCFVYCREKSKRLFAIYEIDEANKKLSIKDQFEFSVQIAPTAIIAIKDQVFLVSLVTAKSFLIIDSTVS